MIDYPDAAWNKRQLTENLAQITHLIQSPVFKLSSPFSSQSKLLWIELIRAVGDLVRQALQAGKRIDFTDEVGIYDEQQDITSLLQSMRQSAYSFSSNYTQLSIISSALNYVYGVGTGHFSNGVGFHCEHEDEMTFFVGSDRIYFYRHLTRAFVEARHYLNSIS